MKIIKIVLLATSVLSTYLVYGNNREPAATYKKGVILEKTDPIQKIVPKVDKVYQQIIGKDSHITSGRDSKKHKVGSRHYEGRAIDIRTTTKKHMTPKQAQDITNKLQKELGPKYDVINEINPKKGNHIHMEER